MTDVKTKFEKREPDIPVIETLAGYPLVSPEVLENIRQADTSGYDLLTQITPQQIRIDDANDPVLMDPNMRNVLAHILMMMEQLKHNTFSPFTQQEFFGPLPLVVGMERIGDQRAIVQDLVKNGYLCNIKGTYGVTNRFIQTLVGGIYDQKKVETTKTYKEQLVQTTILARQQRKLGEILLGDIATAIQQESPKIDTLDALSAYVDEKTQGELSLDIEAKEGAPEAVISAHPGLFPLQQKRNFAEGFNRGDKISEDTVKKLVEWLSKE